MKKSKLIDKAVKKGILSNKKAYVIEATLKNTDILHLKTNSLTIHRAPEIISCRKGKKFENLEKQRVYKEWLTDKEEGLITESQSRKIKMLLNDLADGRLSLREASRIIGLINSGVLYKINRTKSHNKTVYTLFQKEVYTHQIKK